MKYFIGGRGIGKTTALIVDAKMRGIKTIVVIRPDYAETIAKKLGIAGLKFMSYAEFYAHGDRREPFVVDELASFVQAAYPGLRSYSLSIED